MPTCKCTNPCSCYLEQDGVSPSTLTANIVCGEGRYNTIKTGSGTDFDPYVIEFLDSEFFEPDAGKVIKNAPISVFSGASSVYATGFEIIEYQTPNEQFITFIGQQSNSTQHKLYVPSNRFWFVHASADFIFNGSTNGVRRISIRFNPPGGLFSGPKSNHVVVGDSTTGVGEDMSLSCSGVVPQVPVVDFLDPVVTGPGGSFVVSLYQNSGSNMNVQNIKFSMVAL